MRTILAAAVALFVGLNALAEVAPGVVVKVEEGVYDFANPDNGSGPMWSYGCSVVARLGDDVYVSQMETGKDAPKLCNTRWRLLKRTPDGWQCVTDADRFAQREPCPLATTSGNDLFMYVNDSTEPPGTQYGNCEPHLLHFTFNNGEVQRSKLSPRWAGTPYFTDHSYRGYAADAARGELLMLNIDAKTSVQNACLLSAQGETLATGAVSFPIRACYPQVALRNRAVHILAIGDIVEPVEEWKKYKFEQTQRTWDYVFRILYYTQTPDLVSQPFSVPMEIANVDKTAGYIGNQDLWIAPDGSAYIMYTETEVASALLRDKFFPGRSLIPSLHLAVVKDGQIARRKMLVQGTDQGSPGCARFHETPDGNLYAVAYVSGAEGGVRIAQVFPESDTPPVWASVPMQRPVPTFCLASIRAGNKPSDTIDLFGQFDSDTMAYAQILLQK